MKRIGMCVGRHEWILRVAGEVGKVGEMGAGRCCLKYNFISI